MIFKKADRIKSTAMLILFGYLFFGTGIVDGMVLCLYSDGQVAIEVEDAKSYLPPNTCGANYSNEAIPSDALESGPAEQKNVVVDRYECSAGDSCKDIPLSISNSVKQFIIKKGDRGKLLDIKRIPFNVFLFIKPVDALNLSSAISIRKNYHATNNFMPASINTIVLIS